LAFFEEGGGFIGQRACGWCAAAGWRRAGSEGVEAAPDHGRRDGFGRAAAEELPRATTWFNGRSVQTLELEISANWPILALVVRQCSMILFAAPNLNFH
jgi:hypothetical protein